jgi:hypothetical protein
MNFIQSIKQRVVANSLVLVIAGVLLAAAGIRGAKAESTNAKASDAGVWMIVTHKVYDYNRWKPVHDRSASIKRNYGWKKCAVFAVAGDRNTVMVMEQFASLDKARAFAESNDLRDEMAASGVSSEPDIRFVDGMQGELQP